MIPSAIDITFAPVFDWPWLAVAAALTVVLTALGLWRGARGTWARAFGAAILIAALANPTLVAEDRDPRDDIALIVVDESPSQSIGDREEISRAATDALVERMGRLEALETRVVRVNRKGTSALIGDGQGTRLGEPLLEALANVPSRRLAGIAIVTDGRIHDADSLAARLGTDAPVHVMLSGREDEQDRRLVVEHAPTYGMVDKTVTVKVRVLDPGLAAGTPVPLTLSIDGEAPLDISAPANRDHAIEVQITHGGQTILELEAAAGPNELSLVNNRAVLAVNGVRDRLRVLMVSGSPHAGERTWRDLLKADPSVDLVHFTILRPPEKQDGTPTRELSLIAFPTRELFELKLDEFDLVVFDRYRRRGLLPRAYLANIADFVRKGGALLESSGPTFATRLSLARTPLGAVLPNQPTGNVIEQGFRPTPTEDGLRHPVTATLPGASEDPDWGRWFRQIEAVPQRGSVLMTGIGDRPLLVLDRVDKGRVAHLLSDHIWLWKRGYEGGGPQAEMLRRTAHWLMREPDLEENDLRASVAGARIDILRRALDGTFEPVTVTYPDGETVTVDLEDSGPGQASATIEARMPGLYRLSDSTLTRLVAVGALNPLEWAEITSSPEPLSELVEATSGGIFRAANTIPSVRRVAPERAAAGRNWIGFRQNGDYVVTGVTTVPLLPAAAVLFLVLGLALLAWRRESA